jgi:hypothetical protein
MKQINAQAHRQRKFSSSATQHRRRRPASCEALEQRQLMALTITVREPNGASSAAVTEVGQVINLQVLATITSADQKPGEDALQDVDGNFDSTAVGTHAVDGNLTAANISPFNAPGSSPGTDQPLTSDGNIDVGSKFQTVVVNGKKVVSTAGEFSVRSGAPVGLSGGTTVNNGTALQFEIATLTYTVTNLAEGGTTAINFYPASLYQPGIPDAADWIEAGVLYNNLYSTTGAPATFGAGAPFTVSGPLLPLIKLTSPAGQSATAGKPASVSLGSFTESNAVSPFKDNVNWGDGSSNTVLKSTAAGTLPATSHTFAKAGTFTVTETVTDANGNASNTITFKETVAAPVNKLVFSKQPANIIAGKAISPAVVVDIENAQGQIVTTDDSTVTLSIEYGSSSTVQKTITVNAVKGIAAFSSTVLTLAGTCKLKVTGGSLDAATSSSFTVSPAAADKLVFDQSPENSKVGKAIAPAVTVKVEDAFGNLVTTDKSKVTITIATAPTGGKLTGTTSITAVAGIATFSDLILSKAGSYSLKATDGGLVDVVSSVVSVS